MSIRVKGNKIIFTGEDERVIREYAKKLGVSFKTCALGIMWESAMHMLRQEAGIKEK